VATYSKGDLYPSVTCPECSWQTPPGTPCPWQPGLVERWSKREQRAQSSSLKHHRVANHAPYRKWRRANWIMAFVSVGIPAVVVIWFTFTSPVTHSVLYSPYNGATAMCRDGTESYSQHHQGTCSFHDGVATWLDTGPTTSIKATRHGTGFRGFVLREPAPTIYVGIAVVALTLWGCRRLVRWAVTDSELTPANDLEDQ
jgi:hypothetical protein